MNKFIPRNQSGRKGPRRMIRLKKLFLIGCLALPAGFACAQGVTHDFGLANNLRTNETYTSASMVTNTVGTNITYGVAITNDVIDLSLYQNAVAMLAFTPATTNGGTNAITLTFARSLDNVIYETLPRFAFGATIPATTAPVALATNLDEYIGCWPFLKLISVNEAEVTSTLTNVSLKLATKRYLR